MIIQEASTYIKTFKCPYCTFRADRKKLITHIEKKHQDLVPEGFTPTRIVFNIINKKEKGICTECGKETEWNEIKARYERLCKNPKCIESYLKKVKSRMINTYGVDNLLGDPKHQEKMLANRKISGMYKFSDGGERQYTGKYEKKALEFFDKVLNCKSEDIITPGPIIEYVYEGKKHIWITDILYVPYNLVIEVKDGGDNPNNRPMKSYREKQIEKEKAIVKSKRYNYLRLTNNNFAQLFQVFGELKMQLIEDNKYDKVISINEEMFSTIGGMLPMDTDNTFIVNYKKGDTFGMAYSKDINFEKVFVDGKIVDGKELLKEASFNLYATSKTIDNLLEEKYYTVDDILLDKSVREIYPLNLYNRYIQEIVESSLIGNDYYVNKHYDEVIDECVDSNGYFYRNKESGIRTVSGNKPFPYKSNSLMLDIIKKGVL